MYSVKLNVKCTLLIYMYDVPLTVLWYNTGIFEQVVPILAKIVIFWFNISSRPAYTCHILSTA